ncbi:MAG: hypothetical protein JWQ39_1448 [Glaciihabitans sp.]|nr:hypothetical protein [Glaciihabitans sp.]
MERVNPRRPDGLGETRGWLVLIGLCGLLVPLRLAVLIKLLGPFVRLGLARFLSTPLDSSNPSNSSNNTNNTNNTNPLELLQLLQLLQLLELLVIFRKHSF